MKKKSLVQILFGGRTEEISKRNRVTAREREKHRKPKKSDNEERVKDE